MRTMLLSILALLVVGCLFADQMDMPVKGRFDYFQQPAHQVSKLDNQSKNSPRYQIWSTVFDNSAGWTLNTGWSVGIPTMGPTETPEGGCLATNLNGFYANNSNTRAISPLIQIPAASYVELSFQEWFELESDYDFGWVEIKQNNNYYRVDARSGSSGGQWRETAVDITRWQGSSIQLVFHLTSDSSYPSLGWYLDSAAIDMVDPLPLELGITGINISNLPSVYLNASVLSPSGPVIDLTQANFSVWENSAPQQNNFSVISPDDHEVTSTDIVFVLDVTGSMGQEIESVRVNMQAFMNHLDSQNMDYRIGFVVFGDIVYVYNQYSFYTNFTEIMSIISSITLGEHGIGSGADAPENQLEAMAQGSIFNWRPGASRVMIMLTDATAHHSDDVTSWTVNNLLADRLLPNEVMVFPIFDVSSQNQMDQYIPIAQNTNPSASYYHIYDNFNAIIEDIGEMITSLYTVHYISPVPADDPMSRIVKLSCSNGNHSSEDYAVYLPGISPIISRVAALEALDHNPVPAGQALDVELKIEDRVPPGLLSQSFMWRPAGTANWQEAQLTLFQGDFYHAVIPAQDVSGVGIEYYITASDGQTTTTLPSTLPDQNPFCIAILPANPVNFGTPTAVYNPGGPFSVSVSATADLSLQLSLFYRPMGSLVYETLPMAGSGGTFNALINEDLGSLGVQYFLVAVQTNQLRTYLGSSDVPLFVAAGTVAQTAIPSENLITSLGVWPNPISSAPRSGYVSIGFKLEAQSGLKAQVFNLKGQLIKNLTDKSLSPGQHTLNWDLQDESGKRVSSGIYLYRLQAGGCSFCGKMLITK